MFSANWDSKELMQALTDVEGNIKNGARGADVNRDIAREMQINVIEHFNTRREPKGFWKDKKKGGQSWLYKSGALKSSIKPNVLNGKPAVTSDKVYAHIHNTGGQAGKGLKATIPQREFMWLDNMAIDMIKTIYYKFIKGKWAR